MRHFLCMLVLGPGMDTTPPQGFAGATMRLRQLWLEPSFGVVRLGRLLTHLALFFFPTMYVDALTGSPRRSVIAVAREIYFLAVFCLFAIALVCDWHHSLLVVFLVLYMMAEITLLSLGKVFPWGHLSLDPTRSVILAIMNYFEMCIGFAIIYRYVDCLSVTPLDALSALYFSLVTATTVGYDDISPRGSTGRIVVMLQLAVTAVFVIIVLGHLISRIGASDPSGKATPSS